MQVFSPRLLFVLGFLICKYFNITLQGLKHLGKIIYLCDLSLYIKNKSKQYQAIEPIDIECSLCPVITEDTKVKRQSWLQMAFVQEADRPINKQFYSSKFIT